MTPLVAWDGLTPPDGWYTALTTDRLRGLDVRWRGGFVVRVAWGTVEVDGLVESVRDFLAV